MNPGFAAGWLRKRLRGRQGRREEMCVQLPRMTREQFEQYILDRREVEFFLMRCSVPTKGEAVRWPR